MAKDALALATPGAITFATIFEARAGRWRNSC